MVYTYILNIRYRFITLHSLELEHQSVIFLFSSVLCTCNGCWSSLYRAVKRWLYFYLLYTIELLRLELVSHTNGHRTEQVLSAGHERDIHKYLKAKIHVSSRINNVRKFIHLKLSCSRIVDIDLAWHQSLKYHVMYYYTHCL